MIEEKNGRFKSILTPLELEAMLEEEIRGMSADERIAAELLFGELLSSIPTDFKILKAFSDAEYKYPPVDIRTFIEDPYYLGKTCGGGATYEGLIASMEELFANGYRVAVFTGSIGSGKTHSASICIAYAIYQISCLRDAHKSLGLSPGSDISIIALSVTTALAREVAFENIVTKIVSSQYFNENFPCKALKHEMRFPNHLTIRPLASTDHSMLGKNVIAVFLDEGNFLNQNRASAKKFDTRFGEKDRAEVIYNLLLNRMSSRFMKQGKTPGLFVIASSKQTESDFTSRLIQSSRNDSSLFVRDFAKWDLSPNEFKPGRFHVLVGPGATGTKIVEPEELEQVRNTMPDGSVLFEVPIDLKPSFERDLDSAVRDLAGIATQAIAPYFRRQDKLLGAVKTHRKHPFSSLTLVQQQPGSLQPSGRFLWDELCEDVTAKYQTSSPLNAPSPKIYVPKYFPRAARHVHIDLSLKNDATGFVCGCIAGWKDVVRQSPDGAKFVEKAPIYYIDLMLQIDPPLGGEIDLGGVRNLVYDLSAHGFSITMVSFDRFQPYEGMQALQQRGYHSELIPLSKSTAVYDILREAFYEDRIILYHYAPLFAEMAKLMVDVRKRKIDHEPGGKCFVGETRVCLLDGSFPRIDELVGKSVDVYSVTGDGRVVPGKAVGRCSGETTELVDVVLDTGAVERCTPDHLWMLRDGSYKEARYLRPGIDRLMPMDRQWPRNGGYETVTDLHNNRVLTHHMVLGYGWKQLPSGYIVHHKNSIKTDNRPENLELVLKVEHTRGHTNQRYEAQPQQKEAFIKGGTAFNLTPEGRALHAEVGRRVMKSRTREEFIRAAKNRKSFRSDITHEKLDALRTDNQVDTANAAAKVLGCGRNVIMRLLKEKGVKTWQEFLQTEPGRNHKVRAVIPVLLTEPVKIYDLTVADHHNFALASGVVVHNSDLSDALAGCVYTLSMQKLATNLPIMRSSSGGVDTWMEQQRKETQPSYIPASPTDVVSDIARKGILMPMIGLR